jgi:hypothetical protein
VYVNYTLFMQLAGLLFSGSKSLNGILVDEQLYFAVFVNFILLNIGSMVVGSGPLEKSGNLLAPEDAPSQALLLQVIAMNFWVYDAGFVSGPTKYLAGSPELSKYAEVSSKWFIITLITSLCMAIFTANYETFAKKKQFCGLMVIMHLVVEVFERFINYPEMVDPSMKLQNSCIRIVLISAAAYGYKG